VALWHGDYGWIDSTRREWRDTVAPHEKRWPILFPFAVFGVMWGATVGRLL